MDSKEAALRHKIRGIAAVIAQRDAVPFLNVNRQIELCRSEGGIDCILFEIKLVIEVKVVDAVGDLMLDLQSDLLWSLLSERNDGAMLLKGCFLVNVFLDK